MFITHKQLENLRPDSPLCRGKTILTIEPGLFLKLQWEGSKPAGKGHPWRFSYTRPSTGKRAVIGFGQFPATTLEMARERAKEARADIAKGTDPTDTKKGKKKAQEAASDSADVEKARSAKDLAPSHTVQGMTQDWLDFMEGRVAAKTTLNRMRTFKRHIWPVIGSERWDSLDPKDLYDILLALQEKHAPMAANLRKWMQAAFKWRIALSRDAHVNPAEKIEGTLLGRGKTMRHHPRQRTVDAVPGDATKPGLRKVLQAVRDLRAQEVIAPEVYAAVMVQAYAFQRPGCTVQAEWADIDLKAGLWTVPASKLKGTLDRKATGDALVIPMPRQMVKLLEQLHTHTGHTRWVFASSSGNARKGEPINKDTIAKALNRAVGHGIQSPHGFRGTAASMIVDMELGRNQWVQCQLDHAVGVEKEDGSTARDPHGKAYVDVSFTKQRGVMLQKWADFLDGVMRGDLKLAA